MRAPHLLAGLLAALTVAAPAAAQTPVDACAQQCHPHDPDVNDPPIRTEGPVNVVLYSQAVGFLHRADLTVEPRHPGLPDIQGGILIPTLVTETGTAADVHLDSAHFQFQSCPGPITVDEGKPARHCHSGVLGGDLRLAGDELALYLYLNFDPRPSGPADQDPGHREVSLAGPIGLRATLAEGAHGGPHVFAHGDTGLMGPFVTIPGTPNVFEFRVPLRVLDPVIPPYNATRLTMGFLLSAQLYQAETDPVRAAQANWRLVTTADLTPRVILPLANPLDARGIVAERAPGGLLVTATFGTPLGAYDLRPESLHLDIQGTDSDLVPVQRVRLVQGTNDHDGVQRPVVATWHVDLAGMRDPASFRFNASAENLQGTFRLHQALDVEWAPLEGQLVPAPAALASAFALAAAVRLHRRRT